MTPAVPVAVRLRNLVWSLMTMVWVLALVGPMLMVSQHLVSERISWRYTPAIDDTHRAIAILVTAQSDLRLYHEILDTRVVEALPDQRAESLRLLRDVRDLVHADPAEAELAARAETTAEAWWDEVEDVRSRIGTSRPTDITAPIEGFTEFRTSTGELLALLEGHRDRLRDLRQVIIMVGVALALAAIAAATLYGRSRARRATAAIVTPIQALDEVVARQRAGDEEARADADRGPTEVRNLAGELNSMLDQSRAFEQELEHLTTTQSVVLTAGRLLRESASIDEAAQAIARTVTAGLDCDLCVLRFRSTSGEEVTRFHAAPSGGLAHLDSAEVAEFVPATPPQPSSTRTVVNPVVTGGTGGNGGPRSLVLVPIRVGLDRLGTIMVADADGPHPWRAADTTAVEQIAGKFAHTLFERMAHEAREEALRRLQDLDRRKDLFVTTVSHELRTPLTSIAGYAEMLADGSTGELAPSQLKLVEVIDRNTRRLQWLIEDILLLSSIEDADARAVHRRTDLTRLAEVVAENLAPVARHKGVDLVVVAPSPAPVMGDPAHLERALTNLASNALKFSPEGETVTVTVERTGEQVVASVTDRGIGIPATQVPELFTRFYRASNAVNASIPGTGLGLSIVRSIAAEHGGTADVTSREGHGSTFRLKLPAATD